jgi:hypothetical protein
MLNLKMEDTGRYRDCYISDGKIVIYTWNGGGNREAYQDVIDELAKHPCYLYDEDDSFDCTYCSIYFTFPEEYVEELKKLDSGDEINPSDKWTNLINSLKDNK